LVGILAAGCSSSKSASGTDTTTVKDTSKMVTPMTDTSKKDTMMKKDTMKKDTTHH
jgi:ABC-type glycerol-3-phosphate transport system substrate-binding protein